MLYRSLTVFAVATALFATPLVAGSPDEPGVFGRDVANNVQNYWTDTFPDDPGASAWGTKGASVRKGENGQINQDYKKANGGAPNPANDNGSGND